MSKHEQLQSALERLSQAIPGLKGSLLGTLDGMPIVQAINDQSVDPARVAAMAATAIGVERVASDRYHWYDVVAGAGLGIASAELTWWLSDMLFPQRKYGVAIGTSGNTIDVTVGL